MALILSAATGNFNAGATWVGGIVPGVGDEARASTTHVVTITANVTCTEISNAGTGTFILNSGVTLTANVTHKSATASINCLTFSAASPATASIVGICTGASTGSGSAALCSGSGTLSVTGNVIGGSATNGNCVFNSSTGTVNITGNLTAGSATNAAAAFNSSTGTINVIGNVTASTSAGVTNNGAGAFTITGNVLAAAATGVNNASTGSVTITGSITASTAAGVTNSSTATLTISGGTYTASTVANAVISTNASSVVRVSGSFIYASNGFVPINAVKFILLSTPTLAKTRYALNGSTTYVDMFTADNSLGQAAITDVRFGTVYASGALTGVAYIPAVGSVAAGVLVGSGGVTGTATLTEANVRAALGMASANLDTQLAAIPTAVTNANAVWDELMSSHTTAGTYGGRVVRSTNANNELQLNAQNHAAANVHQFQAAVIESVAFATSAVTLFTGAMRTELTPELTEITEIHAIHGLDIANALTVTPTLRSSGAITQNITGNGTTSTIVTRI